MFEQLTGNKVASCGILNVIFRNLDIFPEVGQHHYWTARRHKGRRSPRPASNITIQSPGRGQRGDFAVPHKFMESVALKHYSHTTDKGPFVLETIFMPLERFVSEPACFAARFTFSEPSTLLKNATNFPPLCFKDQLAPIYEQSFKSCCYLCLIKVKS